MKHTKGPWYPLQYANYWVVQKEDSYSETDLLNEETCPDAEANAKLMATAPDLLKLAQHVIAMHDDAYLSGHPEWVEIVNEAKSAIAKAEVEL